MDQIRTAVERIADLSADELSSLTDEILSTYQTIKENDLNQEVVAQLRELAEFAQAVKSEKSRREAEAAELAAAADQAGESIAALEEPEVEEEVAEEVAEEPTEVEDEAEASTADAKDEDEEEPLAEDEEIDPETGERRKKRNADDEPEVEDENEASVNEPTESGDDNTPSVEDVSEAAVSEPEVPEAVEENQEPEVSEEAEAGVITADADVVTDSEQDSEEEEPVEETTEEENPVVDEEVIDDENLEKDSEDPVDNLNIEVPEEHQPQPKSEKAPVSITAGADIPGVSAGSILPNMRAVSQAIIDRRRGMGRTSGGDGEQHTIATFTTSYPESRTLDQHDVDTNEEKIRNVVSPEAIVAAGGLLGPVESNYDLFGLEENLERPVRDSLAVFNADRGGIRFLSSPVLGDLAGATSVWTIQDDEDALDDDTKVKPCIRVQAAQPTEVFVDAIPLCLTFGNIGARFFPELVERHTRLGMMWHARFAEQRLITRIGQLSTSVTTETELGVARDVLVAVEKAAAGYRNRHRMDDSARLRVIFPSWVRNALRADLTKQIPASDADDSINLTDARIDAWFATRAINVTWAHDGEAGQYFAAQAEGALNEFPESVVWYLFAEGTFLFLDGGTLDLGLVRDSTLNSTNDYKMFFESFEGVAKVGVESLRVTTPVNIYGATAATVDTIGAAG